MRDTIFELEELSNNAVRLANMFSALYSATFEADNNPKCFEGAMCLMGFMLTDLSKDLKTLSDKQFESIAAERKRDVA